MSEKKQLVCEVIIELVSSLLYYDRKEDEQLQIGDIEKLWESGEFTIDDMVNEFRNQLTIKSENLIVN